MTLDVQSIRHDAYYLAYLPAILALHERLSTKAVLRRYRENALALVKVEQGIDADMAANGGKATDMDLQDEYDHKADLACGLREILNGRGVEVCEYCLTEHGWHEAECREALIIRTKRTR